MHIFSPYPVLIINKYILVNIKEYKDKIVSLSPSGKILCVYSINKCNLIPPHSI